jgi:hypothetical protein
MAASLLCCTVAQAKKPDKPPGGGGDPVPGGTVYFRQAGQGVWQMNSDGSNPQLLPNALRGLPSHALHAGERWFVKWDQIGDPFPQGFAEVWAGSETGTLVPLVAEPDVEIITPPIWTPDDLSVSFIGERWLLGDDGQPLEVIEVGLYRIDLVYADGNLIGSDPESLTFLADLSFELQIGAAGITDNNYVVGHSWSPDQSAVVFGVRPQTSAEIWVVDLAGVIDPFLLDNRNGVGWPEWSPDGSRIGYVSTGGTVVYDIATDSSKSLKFRPNYSWNSMFWSPDGSHCIVDRWDNVESESDGVFRFTADLRGKTELTQGLCAPEDRCVFISLGWRD